METATSRIRAAPGPVALPQGTQIDNTEALMFRAFAVSPDGSTVAGIQIDRYSGQTPTDRIVLCEARTGKVIRRWNDGNKLGWVCENIAFSPDGRLLATSTGSIVHVWDVATGKEVQKCVGHLNDVRSLSFSANPLRLASASADSTVLIWKIDPLVGVNK